MACNNSFLLCRFGETALHKAARMLHAKVDQVRYNQVFVKYCTRKAKAFY